MAEWKASKSLSRTTRMVWIIIILVQEEGNASSPQINPTWGWTIDKYIPRTVFLGIPSKLLITINYSRLVNKADPSLALVSSMAWSGHLSNDEWSEWALKINVEEIKCPHLIHVYLFCVCRRSSINTETILFVRNQDVADDDDMMWSEVGMEKDGTNLRTAIKLSQRKIAVYFSRRP